MVLFSGPTFQKKKSSRTVAPREIRNDAPSTQIFRGATVLQLKLEQNTFYLPGKSQTKGERRRQTDIGERKQTDSSETIWFQWSTYKTNYDPLIFVLSKLYLHLYHVRVQKFPGDGEGFQRIIILQGEGVQEFKKLELNILEGGLVMEIPSQICACQSSVSTAL